MQPGGRHRDDHVTGLHAFGSEHVVGLDDADAGRGDVVVIGRHQPGVLGGFAAQQRAAGQHAAVGDAGDDLGDALGHRAADGDVVLKEQRFGAAHHQVVDDHRDEVQPDGVVLVHGLRDRQLGADAVGRGGEQGFAVAAAQREQPGEAAEPAAHLGSGRLLGQRLEQFDGPVTRFDVHPGRCIGGAVPLGPLALAHRAQGYRSAPWRCTRQASGTIRSVCSDETFESPIAGNPSAPPLRIPCGHGHD